MQVFFAGIDNRDLPDQQHLGGVLQMCFIRPLQVAQILITGGFSQLIDHRFQRDRRDAKAFAQAADRAA